MTHAEQTALIRESRLKQLRYEALRRRWRALHPNVPAASEAKA